MWNFQRIICIWICCVSCMFGTTQLSSRVQAVPYEYFDDHEQNFYDLDTEQIQAKYDARLLSQQMLQTEQQQQQHLANLKGFNNPESGDRLATTSLHISTATTKSKSNDGHTSSDAAADVDDDDERNDWLEETATKAAALTSAITETLDELHLPRAASCFTNGQKYTHGQKVPRLDNCEVCLCMDGEIFCWWEKCDKKPTKASTSYEDYSTPFEESSTTHMQLNPKTTYKTTLKPMKKPKTNEDYKYDDDDSAEIRGIEREYEGLKEQRMLTGHELEPEQQKIHNNKQVAKKKTFQWQDEQKKHNTNIKEQNKNNRMQEAQHKQYKTSEHYEQHHHAHYHNNNRNNKHDYRSSSKILNFPENLPSVLYYDYKTEEHHQHQHQHHEQHLKHQKQKQLQQLILHEHEKELKQNLQVQEQQHHEYGQDFRTYSRIVDKTQAAAADRFECGGEGESGKSESKAGDETKLHNGLDVATAAFKHFSNGNENIYNGNLPTDSDILPEPPTKKPKFSTSITNPTSTAKTTGIPISQFYRLSTSMMTTTSGTIAKSTTLTRALTDTTPTTASVPSKKQIISPWEHNESNRDKTTSSDIYGDGNNKDNESSEHITDTYDQDDSFHRWLISTETKNKNSFTLNDAIMERGASVLNVADESSELNASNNDYIVDDRNYENIDLEGDEGLSVLKTKIKLTTALNSFDMVEKGEGGTAAIYYENSQKPKYEQHFSEFNTYNNNMASSSGINTSSGKINNKNISSFSSSPYRDCNKNNNSTDTPTNSSGEVNSLTNSNEDNGIASVVNIDINLIAASVNPQRQQEPQLTNIVTTNQHRQMQLQDFGNEKQVAKTKQKFTQTPFLTSNTNTVDNNNPLYSITNDNTRNVNTTTNNNNNITNIVGNGPIIEEQTERVTLSSGTNNFNNNSASSHNVSSGNDSFKFSHVSAVVSKTNATTASSPPTLATLNPERQCNVMGTFYKIGDILPQDTGNCLQCICIDGSTSDDTPRVTCSPHNCPPLVLPDLFDATGY